ncbi:MAG TPA: efflux RND transporter periplasmic adaptor subunit [Syntrophorhabdaceae bacterium]|nr:efflux RND transporter periplasmic adaptor subunit [Syntrophorhabdaceae bacterium]
MRKYAGFLLLVAVLSLAVWSCSKSGQGKESRQKQDIKTHKVTVHEIQSYIDATGSVQADLEGTSRVISNLAGNVSQIIVKVGDRVTKGDPILIIKSPDATDTYSSYLSQLAQLKQSERIYTLNKQLFEIGAVTKNDLLNSEAAYEQMRAITEGLKRKLAIYGCAPENVSAAGPTNCSDTITVRAPIGGYVADIQAHMGDRVDQSTTLLTVADPKNVVIVANIYDTDVPKIKKGSNVTFNVDTYPDIKFRGIVSYVSDVSDTDSKTVKTFIKILDRKDLFKQNMFLRLKIEDQKKLLPLIPQSAMLYKEGKFYVYQPTKDGKNELKEVKPIKELPERVVAVEGLRQGDEIVLSAIELEKP